MVGQGLCQLRWAPIGPGGQATCAPRLTPPRAACLVDPLSSAAGSPWTWRKVP